jgi:hypothetical protein
VTADRGFGDAAIEPRVPQNRQGAHRQRRLGQHPQTAVRRGPQPPRPPRRSRIWTRSGPDRESSPPQPGQDRGIDRLIDYRQEINSRPLGRYPHPGPLADEVLTPDSPCLWPAGPVGAGAAAVCFDMQFVRDWSAGWAETAPAFERIAGLGWE